MSEPFCHKGLTDAQVEAEYRNARREWKAACRKRGRESLHSILARYDYWLFHHINRKEQMNRILMGESIVQRST